MSSSDTQFKKGRLHRYWGKSSPALGKHWKLSDETKKRMSKSQKGKPHPWISKRKGVKVPSNSNELHPDWKGEDARYTTIHSWVRRKLGRPDKCKHCGKSGLSGKQIHWANKNHLYKRNLDDWLRLCRKCHWKYDNEKKLSSQITC